MRPIPIPRSRPHPQPEAGFSVLELMVACTIFALALLATGFTLLSGVRAHDETDIASQSTRVVRDLMSEIQELCNVPQDLTNFQGIGAVYDVYHNQTIAVPQLPNGTVTFVCYPNEATVPVLLGGPQDLNFDGDTSDDLGGASMGTDLQLVPMEITVNYTDERGPVTQIYHRCFSQTTD